jgi:hypothetical protein
MEVYYYVFENIAGRWAPSIHTLIRIPPQYCNHLEHGASVVALFNKQGSRLVLDTIMPAATPGIKSDMYFLKGTYIGVDQISNESMIGFEFDVTESEWSATRAKVDTTIIIIASFNAAKAELIFSNIESMETVNKKPKMYK